MADPACAPLRRKPVSDAIRSAVEWQLGKKAKDLDLQLRHCTQTSADGFTEATLVAHIKGTGQVHTFRVTTDAQGNATSVRHEGLHVQTQHGFDGRGPAATGAKKQMNREEITKWVWISLGIAAALAIIITIIVFVVKQKQKTQDASVGAALRKNNSA